MKPGKPKSKRTPVRLRHKIEKASAAKQRKERKLAKKNPEWRSRLKKDPGIPNLFPYKDRIIGEFEEKKRLREEELVRKREEAKALKSIAGQSAAEGELPEADGLEVEDELLEDDEMEEDESDPMAALLASARARAAAYEKVSDEEDDEDDEEDMSEDETPHPATKADPSARAFSNLFPTVLSTADILLYVLDARDPASTRSIPTERQITAHGLGSKRLILILNKIDLVPPQVLSGWLTHLRRYHPTLPLRASQPASNAKTYDHKALTQKATSESLLRALKAYAAKQGLKRALTVGVVGFPNVGKSSVINTLVSQLGRRSAPAPVGAEAGITTALRSVKLDAKLTLLDSPGIVFPSEEKAKDKDAHARLILLNALPPKAITDPLPAIVLLLSRISAMPDGLDKLRAYYEIPPLMSRDGEITTDFLVQVARKRGRLGKGGVPNTTAAAMGVLADWRDGRISGWVGAPALEIRTEKTSVGPASSGDSREIVHEWAKEFEMEGLWGGGGEEEESEVVAMEQ